MTATQTHPQQFVYVIESKFGVKIGRAGNPVQRMKALQVGSPHPLILRNRIGPLPVLAASALERRAHSLLSQFRTEGEWFAVSARKAANALKQAQGFAA